KEQIDNLPNQVRLLDSEVYGERVKASAALVKAGPLAKKLLLDVIKGPASDLESVRRAEAILRKIVEGKESPLAVACAHVIARQQIPDAGQTLLGYVPFAADSRVLEEIQGALNALAARDGKLDPVFLTALADKQGRTRAAAAEAIIRAGGVAHKKS